MSSSKHKRQLKKIYQQFKKSTSSFIRKPEIVKPTIIIVIFLFIGLIFSLFKDIPSPQKLTKSPAPISTQILDRNGKILYEIYTDQKRTPIDIEILPEYVKQATISIEDQNFYQHHGLDIKGILRALFKTITGQRLEGGSTITQQLVKNALLEDNSRTLSRKIKEAFLAIFTEIIYSKDEILGLYLNHIPYGGTSYGIQSASKTYFDKNAQDLTLSEATLLAGLPQAPTYLSPFGAHPELAKQRQEQVLNRMQQDGYLDTEKIQPTLDEEIIYASPSAGILAPHFSLMIKEIMVERYGEDTVNLGGLRVTTTLDLDTQTYAQEILTEQINDLSYLKVGNGAALVTQPKTGEILAMIGSKDYFDQDSDGQVNITTALRQPGSSIKPINYATGLLNGWTASTMYLDIPTCFSVTGQKEYCPKNYDNNFRGPVLMRDALANSYNIPAVKQLALNGVESMIATASAMGIQGWTDPANYGLSLTLGGGEVTMLEMATAFGTFANSGITVPLTSILKVETYSGEILEEYKPEKIADLVDTSTQDWETFNQTTDRLLNCPQNTDSNQKNDSEEMSSNPYLCTRVSLPQEVAYIISDIISDNQARTPAFGAGSYLVVPNHTVSVKTGTTNDMRDNWTIGYTPDYLVTTWVGNNDNSPMSYVASGITGASPIWNKIMRYVLAGKKNHPLTRPQNIQQYTVCLSTGLIATQENQCASRSELFIKSVLPPAQINTRQQIWVRREDKQPLLPGDTTIDLDLEEHTVISDPFTSNFCLDCAYPVSEEGKISWPTSKVNYDTFQINKPSSQSSFSFPTPNL